MLKKNLIKKMLFTCVSAFVLPSMVFAADDLFIQSCQRADGSACLVDGTTTQLEAGETVTILMSVETDKKINGFSATVELENMSNFSDFTYSDIWGTDSAANYDSNVFMVMRDPGNIPDSEDLRKEIGSFKVTAGSTLGEAKITFSDIDATYLDGTSVEDYDPAFTGSLVFNVVETSNENTSTDNVSTNTDTNTTTTTNINTGKKTSSTTSNPKTGIKVSLFGTGILLIACGASYLVLIKKNFFNKI